MLRVKATEGGLRRGDVCSTCPYLLSFVLDTWLKQKWVKLPIDKGIFKDAAKHHALGYRLCELARLLASLKEINDLWVNELNETQWLKETLSGSEVNS